MTSTNGKHSTRKRRLDAYDRQSKALELRKAGASFDLIASKLGYKNRAGAFKAVQSALKSTLREPAEEVRKLELERLDRLTLALWPRATGGDLDAIAQLMKIMNMRARLLGLEAPKGIVVISLPPDQVYQIPETDDRPTPEPEG